MNQKIEKKRVDEVCSIDEKSQTTKTVVQIGFSPDTGFQLVLVIRLVSVLWVKTFKVGSTVRIRCCSSISGCHRMHSKYVISFLLVTFMIFVSKNKSLSVFFKNFLGWKFIIPNRTIRVFSILSFMCLNLKTIYCFFSCHTLVPIVVCI